MRAQTSTPSFQSIRGVSEKKSKVNKSSKEKREKKEQQKTLSLLKDLVPTIPSNQETSQLELMQHIIDYIWTLKDQLSEEPSTTPKDDLNDLSDIFAMFSTPQTVTAS